MDQLEHMVSGCSSTGAEIRNIAAEIRSIKRCVIEVCERRHRYIIDSVVAKPITVSVDPRLWAQYKQAAELVGIEAARDDLIKILMEGDDNVFMLSGKTVSIVGFGGWGRQLLLKQYMKRLVHNLITGLLFPSLKLLT